MVHHIFQLEGELQNIPEAAHEASPSFSVSEKLARYGSSAFRDIFRPVIRQSAYAFVVVHNHPSGDPSASDADIRLTRRLGGSSPDFADQHGRSCHCRHRSRLCGNVGESFQDAPDLAIGRRLNLEAKWDSTCRLRANRRPKMAFQSKPESVTLQNTSFKTSIRCEFPNYLAWWLSPTKQSSGTFILKSAGKHARRESRGSYCRNFRKALTAFPIIYHIYI
jgi:proteasome lid subunit RPN8/RPN11